MAEEGGDGGKAAETVTAAVAAPSPGPLERLSAARDASDLLVVAYYRGIWCPICGGWVKMWYRTPGFAEELKARKASLLFVCSESQENADKAGDKWGATAPELVEAGVQMVGDPHNEIAAKLAAEGLVNVFISGDGKRYATHGVVYPWGMAQPAVVAVRKGASKPLYSWAISPSALNLAGAVGRPLPPEVWEFIKAVYDGKEVDGKEGGDKAPAEMRQPRPKSLRYFKEMCVIA